MKDKDKWQEYKIIKIEMLYYYREDGITLIQNLNQKEVLIRL